MNTKTHTIKIPSIEEVSFEIIVEPEITPVEGNAMASGDDSIDRRAEQSIIRQLKAGNVWAWAAVEVRASYHGISESDCLGCCSYKSEEQFKQDGGYYEDMRQCAYEGLISKLKSL